VCQPASCSSTIDATAHAAAQPRSNGQTAAATMIVRSVCPLGNDESNDVMWNAPS
jgi:hypothetical protein